MMPPDPAELAALFLLWLGVLLLALRLTAWLLSKLNRD
jgi:hypothetical protein